MSTPLGTTPQTATADRSVAGLARRLFAALLPEERALIWVILSAMLLCFSTGTGFTIHNVLDGYDNLFAYNLALIFVASRLILQWRRTHPYAAAWTNRPSLSADLSLLRSTVFLFAYLTVYTNVKVRIPVLNPRTHDWGLRMFDRAMLFGHDPVELFRSLNAYPDVVKFLDRVYHHDYIFMALVTVLLYVNNGPRHVRHLITSMGFLYITGVVITAFWPTVGPCFFEPGSYRWIGKLHLDSAESQSMLRGQARAIREAAALAENHEVKAFSGIAAFPSLHVAHCMLLVRFAWTYFPKLNYLLIPVVLLTWIATLTFGWHYLSDGLVGPILVAWAWWASKRLILANDNSLVDTLPAHERT